jgi:hypothetical protein
MNSLSKSLAFPSTKANGVFLLLIEVIASIMLAVSHLPYCIPLCLINVTWVCQKLVLFLTEIIPRDDYRVPTTVPGGFCHMFIQPGNSKFNCDSTAFKLEQRRTTLLILIFMCVFYLCAFDNTAASDYTTHKNMVLVK